MTSSLPISPAPDSPSQLSILEQPDVLAALSNPSPKSLGTVIRRVLPRADASRVRRIGKVLLELLRGETHKIAMERGKLPWSGLHVYMVNVPEFKELYGLVKAIQEAVLKAKREHALQTRAVDGWEEPVWWKGCQVGTVRKFSDKLLELALKASDRDKYGDKQQQQVNLDMAISFEIHGVDHSQEQTYETLEAKDVGISPPILGTEREQTPAKPRKPKENGQ